MTPENLEMMATKRTTDPKLLEDLRGMIKDEKYKDKHLSVEHAIRVAVALVYTRETIMDALEVTNWY